MSLYFAGYIGPEFEVWFMASNVGGLATIAGKLGIRFLPPPAARQQCQPMVTGDEAWRGKMHMIRNLLRHAAFATLLATATVAVAQERIYGGIGIGPTKTYIPQSALGITGATASDLQRSEIGTGAKIFAGYAANPNVAFELGYVDLGKASATRNMTAPGVGSISIDTRNTGWFLDLVGTMPTGFSDISVIGKLGGVATETGKQLSASGAAGLVPGNPSTYLEREINWKLGAGAQYDFSKTISARGEWERYRRLGKDTGIGESETDLFSINLLIKFQ